MLEFIRAKKYGLIGAIIGGVLLTVTPPLLHNLVNGWEDIELEYLTSREDVFEYTKVEPLTNPNPLSAPLQMLSYVTWYEGGWDVTFNDILFCDGQGFVSSETNVRKNYQVKNPGEAEIKNWQYNSPPPKTPAICHIEANIKVCKDEICKIQTLNSEPIIYN